MAKKKETITPPTKPVTTKASHALSKAHDPVGGRVMADASVAARQGVTPGKKKRQP